MRMHKYRNLYVRRLCCEYFSRYKIFRIDIKLLYVIHKTEKKNQNTMYVL